MAKAKKETMITGNPAKLRAKVSAIFVQAEDRERMCVLLDPSGTSQTNQRKGARTVGRKVTPIKKIAGARRN
jgi:hypothetical protein